MYKFAKPWTKIWRNWAMVLSSMDIEISAFQQVHTSANISTCNLSLASMLAVNDDLTLRELQVTKHDYTIAHQCVAMTTRWHWVCMGGEQITTSILYSLPVSNIPQPGKNTIFFLIGHRDDGRTQQFQTIAYCAIAANNCSFLYRDVNTWWITTTVFFLITCLPPDENDYL